MIDATELVILGILIIVLFLGLVWLSMRINAVEKRQADGPSHADIRVISDRMAQISGQVAALSDRHGVTMAMISSIQKHLLEKDA